MKRVYADNNATTQVAPEVLDAMMPYLTEKYGNPSSMHEFGGQVGKVIEDAREKVALALGAQNATEIVFLSCGTESDNTAIRSALATKKDRRKIVTTRVEHPAVLTLCRHLEREGYQVRYLPVDRQGNLNLDDLRDAMDDQVAVVSIMAANNETGVLYPVAEAARIAHQHGALFHTDAVQIMGKVPLNLQETDIDLLSISGHKIHAPKGIGALYIRRGSRFRPMILGGHQERGRRGGTENVPGIVALGKAAELSLQHIDDEQTRVRALRDRLETALLRIPNSIVNGDRDNRLPGTLNISFEFVEGEAMLLMLDQVGICASSGSACTSGTLEPSHVLRALGVPFSFAHGSLRFSFGRYNNDADVDHIIETLPPIIERLREISPFKPA
ncbi:MAG: cysteine desulfurase NifS [Proteobacteria bacterium]|jgi:cysteine desulfurase|nr:cysteine desulfurase NifS [Pseudomonadota bacterium]NLN61526.1 cysteine desulfurase NifS [Myxococcales bacterium]